MTSKPGVNSFWQHWLAKRLPAAREHTLSHKGIFILPSGFGLFWLVLVFLLYLFGTNYQNNLVIGLSLLMASIFVTCLIYGYRNLAGLTLRANWPAQVYAGETLAMPLQLESINPCWQININYPKNRSVELHRVGTNPVDTLVPLRGTRRGRLNPGRLKVSSRFPMGICQAWSHLDMAVCPIVYPRPEQTADPKPFGRYAGEELPKGGKYINGIDEFSGLRDYIKGESLKQVAWKQLAQGRGMLIKQFEQPQGETIWLSLPAQGDLETHLSILSYLVDKYSREQQIFGLNLKTPEQPGAMLPPSAGELHRQACQEALALYGEPGL